ncbi:Bifunctional pinoresinol-lariciresinol reductase 1 [Fusarium oxysporum f. sp. raphani]|uniref:Bifunctional pinoresinol-lariciresinol reductase 1 n=1 Tax=Fusarium oxysporum f. sp. raphani TaxID=96318 RepID=A0A8J5TUQ2_FUSOX|nr:Bifunctional pinoresinol-lariciresinol reductase 1 [Fusarium oxysporum f. sp. raphani]
MWGPCVEQLRAAGVVRAAEAAEVGRTGENRGRRARNVAGSRSRNVEFVILPVEGFNGDGIVPSAITDSRDIGRYVAKIIADPRTLNKSVFAYSEVLTQREIFQIVEEASGEKLDYNYISNEDAMARVVSAQNAAEATGLEDKGAQSALAAAQYTYSTCVRGDNTPEYARYLGYLDGKELYPDLDFIPFQKYVSELIDGTARSAYA